MRVMKTVNKLLPPKLWDKKEEFYKASIGNEWYRNVAIIQSEFINLTFKFFYLHDIKSVCLPVTTGSVTSPMGLGSDSLPVKIDLFGFETFLADSMQFHLEYMLRYIAKGVHYVMPTFRGESADERHLCQFYHSEAEIIGELKDVMKLVEQYLLFLMENIVLSCKKEIITLAGTINHIEKVINVIKKGIKRITLQETIDILGNEQQYFTNYTNPSFRTITSLGEQKLIDMFEGIVWVTNYDYISIPFYQKKSQDGKTGLNGDLLFGIGEVVGCGERNYDYTELMESMAEHKTKMDGYEWYVYMKKHFPLKTSGFGLGMERFLLFIINHNDIRDIQLIPRFNGTNIEL